MQMVTAVNDVSRQSAELERAGFLLVPKAIHDGAREELRAVDSALVTSSVQHRSGAAIAARGLLSKVPDLAALLDGGGVRALASSLLGAASFPIDAMYFDKHARANWTVPGHQDRVMAVADDSPQKGRVRDGVAYAEPTASVLANLLALRIHFDDTDGDTGALSVVPGSHRRGVLTAAQIREVPVAHYVPCAANAGDVLALRPLLLHRSSRSSGAGHRRVLHVVYAANGPGEGLHWHTPRP